jgi:hypothetical protein
MLHRVQRRHLKYSLGVEMHHAIHMARSQVDIILVRRRLTVRFCYLTIAWNLKFESSTVVLAQHL